MTARHWQLFQSSLRNTALQPSPARAMLSMPLFLTGCWRSPRSVIPMLPQERSPHTSGPGMFIRDAPCRCAQI